MTAKLFAKAFFPLALGAAFGLAASAFAQSTVEDRILDLVHDIQRDLSQGRATQAQLEQAERKLEDALDLVRGRTPHDPNDPDSGNRRFISLNDLAVVVGSHLPYESARAMATWEDACSRLENQLGALNGTDRIQSFACGTPENISPWSSQGYYLYGSTATAVILAYGRNISEQPDRSISGDDFQYDLDSAYRSWSTRCLQRLQAVKQQFGDRFAAGSCGTPRNVSPYASQGYYQYQSQIRLWTRSL